MPSDVRSADTQRRRSVLVHRNGFRRVHDRDAVGARTLAAADESRASSPTRSISRIVFVRGEQGAGDDLVRGVIAAHRVDRDRVPYSSSEIQYSAFFIPP